MENEGGVHLKMDYTKGESSRASDLALLNLTGSKGLESHSHNNDSEEKRGQGYGTTSECKHGKPRDGIREEWLNLEVSYSDIRDLTDNFSELLVIGQGGFGKVYRAKLGGRMVAIKILDSTSTQGQREFFQEIEVLYKMQHPNLVKLVGACFEKVRALVYEYLPNGSLEDCLKESPEILTWNIRTRIIYEICLALIYLHSKSVIHADLKPANVLLDANFKCKLSDFGLCRFLPENMTTAPFLETSPMGTPGYTDPRFLDRCILRPGSDLYSLGITVLKLLSGMSPVGLSWKISQTDQNSLLKMIDSTAGGWPFELATEMVYWSLQCCYHNEDSSEVLMGMSTRLKGMLAEIEALQGGRFKPIQPGQRSRRLEPPSHNEDKKDIMGAANPPLSLSSFLEVDALDGVAGGKFVLFDGPSVFTFDDLMRADADLLQSSKYGTVLRAKLVGESEVAVKRFEDDVIKDQSAFEEEVNVLGKIRLENLLALRAYYFNSKPKGEKLLVFDSMSKGSLATFLHARGPGIARIDWPTRIKIAIGIARGLNYLHNHMNIIHGNLSSANILLDDDNNAKISDYELSRLITPVTNSNVFLIAGKIVYGALELSKYKKAEDVYSLGVIILELMTGRSSGEPIMNGLNLPQWVACITKGEVGVLGALDRELLNDNESKATRALVLALDCVDIRPLAWPESHQVLHKLEGIRVVSEAFLRLRKLNKK